MSGKGSVRRGWLDRVAPEAAPGIRVLPLVHERVECAALVRAALTAADPAGIAVELPTTLAAAAEAAVRRLPRISVLLAEEPGSEALAWVVAPGEPFAEALRWAAERDRPRFCVDPDVPYPERSRGPVPDPYALWTLSPERFLGLLEREAAGTPHGDADRAREAGMAYHAREARLSIGEGTLLVLVGAAHAPGVRDALRGPTAHPLARTRRSSVTVRHLHPDSLTGLLPDPPLAHAVWERLRDGAVPAPAVLADALAHKVSLLRFGLRVITGLSGEEETVRRERLLDFAAREGSRAPAWSSLRAPDRRALAAVVWRVAAGSYAEQTGEKVRPWQRRLFFDLARRYARVQGALVGGLFEWVAAARGAADDNLAWEVFDAARTYPWQGELAEIATARLDGASLDLGTRKVRFRRRFFRVKQRPLRLPVRRRATSEDPERWLEAFDSFGVCSYPPEDLVVEDYGSFLQRKAVSILSAERRRVEPFVSGMRDGLDLRETLRHFADGQVWVQEMGRAPGRAGSVIVIFDRDPQDRRYPHRMTWLGEHEQESDMAFYSTPPGDQIVGPGILRATYGGFLLTRPRGRLGEVWEDPDYRAARDKAEVLLLAGVDYSLDPNVVHVGPEAPAECVHRHAAAQAKRIVHIPLGSLSPAALRRIRVVHLLAGRDKRQIARDYIW